MSKFKVRFKLEKLELEIEGEKESVPDVSSALQKHMSGLLSAPAVLAGGQALPDRRQPASVIDLPAGRKTRRRTASKVSGKTQLDGQEAMPDFRHDPGRWGNPQQAWTTAQKAMWLLFVAKNQSEIRDLSASSIAGLFNRHFRESGEIQRGNVSRDLGKCKSKTPAWVGEDASQDPSKWYVTEEGEKIARGLVAQATGTVAATNGAD